MKVIANRIEVTGVMPDHGDRIYILNENTGQITMLKPKTSRSETFKLNLNTKGNTGSTVNVNGKVFNMLTKKETFINGTLNKNVIMFDEKNQRLYGKKDDFLKHNIIVEKLNANYENDGIYV